jgi:hypothetical protein
MDAKYVRSGLDVLYFKDVFLCFRLENHDELYKRFDSSTSPYIIKSFLRTSALFSDEPYLHSNILGYYALSTGNFFPNIYKEHIAFRFRIKQPQET